MLRSYRVAEMSHLCGPRGALLAVCFWRLSLAFSIVSETLLPLSRGPHVSLISNLIEYF